MKRYKLQSGSVKWMWHHIRGVQCTAVCHQTLTGRTGATHLVHHSVWPTTLAHYSVAGDIPQLSEEEEEERGEPLEEFSSSGGPGSA